MYSKIDNHLKEDIIGNFRLAKEYATGPDHAVAIAARQIVATDRQWNGPKGADAFAATLAVLVMANEVKLSY